MEALLEVLDFTNPFGGLAGVHGVAVEGKRGFS